MKSLKNTIDTKHFCARKMVSFFIVVLFSITSLFNLYAQTIPPGRTMVDGVIAVVGKEMIKYSELETSYLQSLQSGENASVTRCEVFESMLINKLMLHQAAVDSIEVTDAEIDQELNSRIRYMVQLYGSQERLEKQMKKTMPEIKAYFHDVVKDNILISQEQSKIVGQKSITPKEVSDFYNSIPKDSLPKIDESYTLSQIVIYPQVTNEEKEIVKERLNGFRERILKGDRFSTLAKMYSDDQASAVKGGELGFFSRGDMVSEFENVAFSLQPGEISPVFETKYGYHIIQMIERRGDRVNCRHILLQPKISAMQLYNAKTKLDSIKSLIDSNKISFEDAIVQYSQDEGKTTGGLIINNNNASAEFSLDAINTTIGNVDNIDFASMNEGDITKPVEFKSQLSNAYRLIKVKKKIPEHLADLNYDFDKIQSLALAKKRTDTIRSWANEAIKRTYIKINDKYKTCNFKLNWLKLSDK